MVTLEGTIKRFVGLSTDTKPSSTPTNTIPAGSSFLESDTGRIARFTGLEWRIADLDTTQTELLAAILMELKRLCRIVEVAHDVEVDDDELLAV